MDKAHMALKQHFSHACASSEIPVYLERRMYAPEIVCSPLAQKGPEQAVCAVPVVEPGPLAELPGHAPS